MNSFGPSESKSLAVSDNPIYNLNIIDKFIYIYAKYIIVIGSVRFAIHAQRTWYVGLALV